MEKEMWLRWFPKYCNHLCFSEKHSLIQLGVCTCVCAFECVRAHVNTSETVFPVLNCRVLQGLSLALDLSVFTQTHRDL